MNNTNYNTWNIGDVKITSIIELDAGELIQDVIQGATPEAIKEIPWLLPHFANKDGTLNAVIQAFVIETKAHKIMVDTCIGNEKNRPEVTEWANLQTNFLEKLTEAGYPPESIDTVLCTHLHFDHVGWNTKYENGSWVPTFPNATYLFAEEELKYWQSKPEQELEDDNIGFLDSIQPILDAGLSKAVPHTHAITDEVSLIPTPGHTLGHVSVVVESNNEKAIITGDVMHHPCQIAHPDWGTDADTDIDKARETRKEFLKQQANSGTLIIGSHFAYPSAGTISLDDEAYRLDTE